MEAGQKVFSKKKPDQLVYLELGGGNGGMLLSISEEGFRFRAVTPVRANGNMPFAFSLDGTHRLEGHGAIEWVEEDGKSGGMRFTEVSSEFQTALSQWLSSAGSRQLTGREVTPAAAAPLDTMEKIRQELRSGYSARQPVEPAPAPAAAAERRTDSVIPDRKPKPPFSEEEPRTKESSTANRLFPLGAVFREPEKPSIAGSAFLKPTVMLKPVPAKPITPGVVVPTGNIPNAASAAPVAPLPTSVPPHSRPHIPPLEDSFEQAWVNAKLTAPPDPPHLSRAAAGSIITLAFAAILGALAYNFRQEIGSIIIQVGQSISGETHPAAPADVPVPNTTGPETKPGAQPGAEQPAAENQQATTPRRDAATESGGAAKPPATSPNVTAASDAQPDGATGATSSAAPSGNAQSSGSVGSVPVLSGAKPALSSAGQPRTEASPKSGALEAGTGQEEFTAARELLRGNNRQRDLSRAVDLLWAGVRKGYVPAEVTLADLFRRGDGVEKNCDQARVLLVAASKKGSLDARQMLEQMAEQGCE